MKLLIVLLLSSALGFAGDKDAKPVMDRYIKALGGAKAVKALNSVHKTGTYVYNGLDHPFEVWKKGNKVRFEIEGLTKYGTDVQLGKKEINVFDGTSVWAITLRNAEPTNEKVRAELEIRSDAYLITSLASHYLSGKGTIELVGKTEVEDEEVMHVRLTKEDGKAEDWYLSTATGLPFKRAVEGSNMFNPSAWIFDDYRKVGKLKFPHYVELEEGLFHRTYLFKTIKTNVKIDDSSFSLK